MSTFNRVAACVLAAVLVAVIVLSIRTSSDVTLDGPRFGASLARVSMMASPMSKKRASARASRMPRATRRLVRQQRVAEIRRRRWVATPAARAQRVRSRAAFRDLSPQRAVAALEHHQPELASRPTGLTPDLGKGEQIVAYPTASAAVVEHTTKAGKAERTFIESVGTPIAAADPKRPGAGLKGIDLSLIDRGQHFRPARAAAEIELPKRSDAPARVGSLSLSLGGGSAATVLGDAAKVVYPGVARDVDTVLEPANSGMEISWVLRSPAAPSRFDLNMRATDGGAVTFAVAKDGSATVSRGGAVVANVAPPVAWDAQGTPVPVALSVSNGQLGVSLDHGSKDLAYPIVVDPLIYVGEFTSMRDDVNNDFTRVGWRFITNNGTVFGTVGGESTSYTVTGMVARPSLGSGIGRWEFDPIRDSRAFRFDMKGVYRDAGPTCMTVGLYGPSRPWAWDDTGWGAYWTSAPNGENWDNAAAGPFGNCWGPLPRSYVQVCEVYCGWNGTRVSYDNRAAFEANTIQGGANTYHWFEGALVYHRENIAPRTDVLDFPTGWTNGSFTARVVGTEDGIGFCSDRNFYPDPDMVPPTMSVTGPGVGNDYLVGGCVGSTIYKPATPNYDQTVTLGGTNVPEGAGPDGQGHVFNFALRDLFGNTANITRKLKVDRTGPQVNFGGRLATYMVPGPTGPGPQFWNPLKPKLRTVTGAADLTFEVTDRRPGVTASGVVEATLQYQRLNPLSGLPETDPVTLAGGAISCAGQNDCDRPAVRIPPSTFNALPPGAYYVWATAKDAAGNAGFRGMTFAKGGGSITSVVDGQATARWVPLQAKRAAATSARFQWLTGTRAWEDIPLDALSVEGDPNVRPSVVSGTVSDLPVDGTGESSRVVLDIEKLLALKATQLTGDQLRVRAVFGGTGVNEFDKLSEDVTIRLDRGGRDTSDHTTDLGAGQVDLLTGNLEVSSTDASVDANGSSATLVRSYSSRYVAKTDGSAYSDKDDGLLGPGWSIGMPDDGLTAFTEVVDLDDPARDLWWSSESFDPAAVPEDRVPAVEVHSPDGSAFVFEHSRSDANADVYTPEAGFEQYSLERRVASDGVTTTSFKLTDRATGASATFGQRLDDAARPRYEGTPEHGTFAMTSASGPSAARAPQWLYGPFGSSARDANGKPTDQSRVVLPTYVLVAADPSQTCTNLSSLRGCFALGFTYREPRSTYNPSARRRLATVSRLATDLSTGAMITEQLAEYRYTGDKGLLAEVIDSRAAAAGSPRSTKYEYDADGLLTVIRPAGQEPITVGYQSAGGDMTKGRLRSVSRPHLVAGAANPNATTTVVYGPRALADGGVDPWDLSPTNVAQWGQKVTPYRATAVFAPGTPVDTSAAGLRRASISYLDALGREVNHAEPYDLSNAASPRGSISSQEYDKWGNVTRRLSPSGRQAALDTAGDVATKAAVANRRASFSFYAEDGRGGARVVREVGPERNVRQDVAPEIVRGRSVKLTTYDESDLPAASRDPGFDPTNSAMPYNLPTKVEEGALSGVSPNGTGGVPIGTLRVTRTKYQLSTRLTTEVSRETAGNPEVRRFVRDARGLELERQQPGSIGRAAPANTKFVYYEATTVVPAGADPLCYGKPAWAGLLCTVGPAASKTAGLRELPTKRYTKYDAWRQVLESVETATTQAGEAQTRTTTTKYDSQGRVTEETITATDGGAAFKVGEPIGTIRHLYDDASGSTVPASQRIGREIETQRILADGTVQSVKRTYDSLGRIRTFADSTSATKVTTYDEIGRVTEELQTKSGANLARTVYTYDATTGRVREALDVGPGGLDATAPMRVSWDVDGRPTVVTYPAGVSKGLGYDETGVTNRVTYLRTAGCTAGACTLYENTVTHSAYGQMVDDTSTLGSKIYSYDSLGRLSATRDRATPTGACTTRTYTYDADSNRKGRLSSVGAAGASCPASGTGTGASYVYDDSDRLTTITEGTTSVSPTYDAWGRARTQPADGGRGKTITSQYFVNDLAYSLSDGTATITNDIDPLLRVRIRTSRLQGQTDAPREVYAYGDESDEPMFTRTSMTATPTVETGWTRYVQDPTGDVAALVSSSGTKQIQVTNVRGDVVAEVNAASPSTLGSRFQVDEFGVPGTAMGSRKLGFLGAKQRESLLGGAVVAMGVRTYSPYAGRFLQVDPVVGGGANAYDYAYQDSCNNYDLDGRYVNVANLIWEQVSKRINKVINTVGEMIASAVNGCTGGMVYDIADAVRGAYADEWARRGTKSGPKRYNDLFRRDAAGRRARQHMNNRVLTVLKKQFGGKKLLAKFPGVGTWLGCVSWAYTQYKDHVK